MAQWADPLGDTPTDGAAADTDHPSSGENQSPAPPLYEPIQVGNASFHVPTASLHPHVDLRSLYTLDTY